MGFGGPINFFMNWVTIETHTALVDGGIFIRTISVKMQGRNSQNFLIFFVTLGLKILIL